jgi:hypothetical protein
MIHPCCSTYVTADSQTRGAAAALRDRDKYRAHAGHLHPRHTFVPASIETYGHLGRPIMRYPCTLSDVASARTLAVTRGSFLASAHRELSVALVQSQGMMCIALVRCCWPRLLGGRCCLGRILLSCIECSVVRMLLFSCLCLVLFRLFLCCSRRFMYRGLAFHTS